MLLPIKPKMRVPVGRNVSKIPIQTWFDAQKAPDRLRPVTMENPDLDQNLDFFSHFVRLACTYGAAPIYRRL